MDLDAYVAEHRGEWRRLEVLSRRRKPTAAEADEMVLLYQRVATHLSVVRSRTPDPALVAELSRLVLSARAAITGAQPVDWARLPRFFVHDLPLAIYQARRWWISAAVCFLLVAAAVATWVINDPTLPQALGMSEADIESLVEHDFEAYYSEYFAPNFGLLVWTNNAWIAAQSLVAGVLLLPVAYVLWQNALSIGATAGLMIANGRADVFFGLIAPHGLLELTAIFVAAGIGLRVGWSWVVPGPVLTRGQSLAAAARQGITGAVGLVGVLAVAGLLEAFVTPSILPVLVRDAIGVLVWTAFLVYVFVLGRRAERAEAPDQSLPVAFKAR
ncbi:membrane protein [Catellatospora methionotrophica]|uniref:Membrane protein n=1 Tax=Catellatospora methionotrophica TaxID=121620 RepID=A0A8J3PFR1_9ACTN|nr:stage II sporulation protein M [Catellatospora methionotrophica]GIG13496.1 membrane protein [Catellatospora methionotrophica]